MKRFLSFLFSLLMVTTACADTPNVVVSILPLYHIAQAVMGKLGEPVLLVPQGSSEHMYSLTPSQNVAIKNADVVIWIGPELETYLVNAFADVPLEKQMALLSHPNMIRYNLRVEGAPSTSKDPHLWLDPLNGLAIAQELRNRLIKLDPDNEERYRQNTDKFIDKISTLNTTLAARLAPLQSIPFLDYHDAFQYFEKRYGLRWMGSLSTRPDVPLSAARWVAMGDLLKSESIRCIFSEPQNQTAALQQFARQYQAQLGIINPLGGEKPAGTDGYAALLNGIADGMIGCLLITEYHI